MQKYKVPPTGGRNNFELLSWIAQAKIEGENFLENQRPFRDIDTGIAIIAGGGEEKLPKKLSHVKTNRLKRQAREMVATASNLRPLWGYKSDNRDYEKTAYVLNKLILGWWHNTFADRKIREAFQFAVVTGTGYVMPKWEEDYMGITGRGDIKLDVLGPRDVIPIQLGNDNELSEAYGIIIKRETPINRAHAMFPEFQDLIKPDRDVPTGLKQGMSKVQRYMSSALNMFGQSRAREGERSTFPTVDILECYIADTRVNNSGQMIPMGKPESSWYYEVPSLGMLMPTGKKVPSPDGAIDPLSMNPLMVDETKPATIRDCLLYPFLRRIICTKTLILEDDTSPWWHGRFPVIPFKIDDWPWDFLGYGIIRDGEPLQTSNNNLLRAIDDSANARLRPPMKYDENLVSRAQVEALDLRQGGQSIGVNMQAGDVIAPLVDPRQYDVPEWIREFVKDNEERMDYQMGVADFTALAKARQTPSADSVEKLEEMAGPLLTDMSRNMERSLRDLGDMVKALFFQFYTTPRKIQVLGADGVIEEDFDFEPGNMVPSHMPFETDELPSRYSTMQRAKWHKDNFLFHITPGSMHEITQMSKKLFYLQLSRDGTFPIDPWTQADVYAIPNFGSPPEDADTVVKRFFAYKKMEMEFQMQMQMEQLQMQQAMMADPNMAMAMQAAQLAAGQGGQQGQPQQGGGNGHEVGRPPSGQKPPHIAQKDGGTRSTVSES